MEAFADYLAGMDNVEYRNRMEEIFNWVTDKYPNLAPKFAWKQPMFTDHGTFIIGFSASKQHMAVAPEEAGILRFAKEITQAGYDSTKGLIRIPRSSPVDFALLERIIEFNIADKAECTNFWRK